MNAKNFEFELNRFQSIFQDEELTSLILSKPYQKEMIDTAVLTLKNIQLLIEEYVRSYQSVISRGDKGLFIFGLLQGLFVGIDALYTIGKLTKLNKTMINLNQNLVLRQIKHIRNDVVGHPTYRLYEQDLVGFCALDFDHIEESTFQYKVYLYKNNQLEISTEKVDMMAVIRDFYREAAYFLQDTIQFFYLKKEKHPLHLSTQVHLLAVRYQNRQIDFSLLQDIENSYQKTMHSKDNHTNRVLWRIRLIRFLFNQSQPNEYVKYLTFLELYKLYSLLFHLEKQLNQHIRFRFISFEPNSEFVLLRKKIKTCSKNIDCTIIHDAYHPLYSQNMNKIFSCLENSKEIQPLLTWIKEQVHGADRDMLYLIGSELKK